MTAKITDFESIQLSDRYTQTQGRVYMTGTQALVRIMLDQARRDSAANMNTAGFISGYRGSPLGGVDIELWREKQRLIDSRIEFLPAINEDLAATAVLGSQQVETNPDKTVDAVFGLWYGKGPGLDRAGDALKHGNAYGSSPKGGVLVVAGDDHGCVSSSMPHQSDVAFMTWFMPTLNPASVAEYLEFGEYGYALSRYTGMWVGFKAISETVESACSFDLPDSRIFNTPDFQQPPDGLHYRWPDLPGPQIEERLVHKKSAVLAFAQSNPIDRHIYKINHANFGLVTTGKGHLDTMEALRLLGIDETTCRQLGIDIYKIGMVWPLARQDALDFVRGKHEVLVIEEKRGIIESQLKEYFYDWPGDKPDLMVGKRDENGNPLVPWTGELSPRLLLPIIAKRLARLFPDQDYLSKANTLLANDILSIQIEGATRTPYFCSGCPHNTSTKVPEGSKALAGIGCHFMASWMDRETSSLIQMGGEGVNWAASSKFTGNGHIFQNLGEGTWYHSGSMAIRQAVAAGTNITYKILYNDAVAMTGGQPVDGPASVQAIAHSLRAEGVQKIILVSNDPEQFKSTEFPEGVIIHHRREMDPLQKQLREIPGVSALIYEQTCATELRRRRKRGQAETPDQTVVINELVCEGCGDCSVESNCLSVEPVDTVFGKKRKINQSSCNKDYSCINGFCPSFVTVKGKLKKQPQLKFDGDQYKLPDPVLPNLDKPYDLLITGVGGTGVITVAALITMAAHLEGSGSSVLDFTGFAQKFGPVLSYVRLAKTPHEINQVRIDDSSADALIGCDVVVSSSPKATRCYQKDTRVALNTASMPTGDIVRHRDASLQIDHRVDSIRRTIGSDDINSIDANALSTRLFGDTVFANVILLGYAWQLGLVPVSYRTLLHAVTLNGVQVDKNKQAIVAGRVAAALPGEFDAPVQTAHTQTLDDLIDQRATFLTSYQNARYAKRFCKTMEKFAPALDDSDPLKTTAAKSLFKLMAYKDEYEVARLHCANDFQQTVSNQFEEGFTVSYHLAPPLLPLGTDARGRPRKREFGQWINRPMNILAAMKFLRGTPADIFSYTAERKMERQLIPWFTNLMTQCHSTVNSDNLPTWQKIMSAPLEIRGYGPVKIEAVNRVKADVQKLLDSLTSQA